MSRKRESKRPRPKSENRGLFIFSAVAVLAVLGCISYWNSFAVPLVFDDLVSIQANSGVQFGDNLRPQLLATRPLLYLTFALDYRIHGQSVWGYHFVNLTIHVLNAILVFLIASHIFGRFDWQERTARLYGLLAAAFFLVHPVQTESVTYISSRSELLSTFFYALALLLFIKRDERKIGFLWSLVIAIPFFLGLLAKETVISLPAVLLSYDFVFLAKADIRRVLRRWRFYVTYIVGGGAAVYALTLTGMTDVISAGSNSLTQWRYFLTQLRVVSTYLRLIVFPAGLNLDYDFRSSSGPFEFSVIASLLLLSSLAALAWYLRKRQPIASFSIVWFFVTLAPTSSFLPIPDLIFEHRLYLPLIGVSLCFPILLDYAAKRLQPKFRVPVVPVAVTILLMLTIVTVFRNQVWRDEISLWSDAMAKSPHKARPYNNLATIYFNRRQFDRALRIAQIGIQNVDSSRDRAGFQEVVGKAYLQQHQYREAAAAFQELTNTPDKHQASTAFNNVGVAYINMATALDQQRGQDGRDRMDAEKQKLLGEAAEAFRKSAELDTTMFFAFDSYINVGYQSGRKDELENDFKLRLQDSKDYRFSYGLGKLALLSGDYETAVRYFEDTVQHDTSQKLIFFNYAYALNQLKRRDEAIQRYLQAIRLDPLFIPAHNNVALVYMQNKDFPKAIQNFEDVIRFDPNHLSAHLNLARIYIQMGDRAAARTHLSKVLSIAPDHKEAMSLWQGLGS